MRRNIFYTALIVLGLAFAVWASSTQGDWSVGGNLAVTGTSVQTGAITATGGVVGDITGDVTGDITGDITGDVTGDVVAGTAVLTAALQGNLPAAAAGNKFHLYANSAVDTVWISTGAAWTKIFP